MSAAEALESDRQSIRDIHRRIQSNQKSINALNSELKRLRERLAKAKNKKEGQRLMNAIRIREQARKDLEQDQLNLNSDLAVAYRALNAIKVGKWVPDNSFAPRNWLDPRRARFRPEWRRPGREGFCCLNRPGRPATLAPGL